MTPSWKDFRTTPDRAQIFLQNQLSQSITGTGHLVLISGGIASGKTELQHDLLDRAESAGALTLSATGALDEKGVNGAVIDQLLANSSLSSKVTDRLTGLLDLDERQLNSRQDQQADGMLARNVCRALLETAREQPMVISVDDLHFADDTSLHILLHLQRRIRSVPLLIVLSQLDRTRSTQSRLRAHFASQPHYFLQLTPMSQNGIAGLIGQTGTPGPNDLSAQIFALSAGNPMLTEALISDYTDQNGVGRPVIGPAFRQALHTVLERPDLSLWETAGAVAVLGEHSGEELVAELTSTDIRTAADRLELLAGAGLLHNGRFRHPGVRDTVLDYLPSVTRTQLHLKAAQHKHQRSASVIEVAEHLIAAETKPQEWAIPVLRSAAEQAMLSDNVSLATRCLELAIAASTDEGQRRAFLHSLIRITWRVNPSAASAYLETLRASAHNGTLARSDSLTLVRHSLWQGDRETFSRAHRVLTSDFIDSQSAAEISLAWQWHFGPIRPSGSAVEAAPDNGATLWNQTAGSLVHMWKQGGSEASNASAERILANCSLGDNTLEALVTAIIALVHGAKTHRAEWWCSRLSAQAAQRGARTWQAMIDAIWATVVLRRGDIASATARAHGALDMLDGQSWGVSISYPLTTLLFADVAEGKFADAARTLQRPVPSAMFDTMGGLQYLRARGHFYLATNRALAAVSDFQKCQQSMQSWNIDALSLMPWRCDLAEANLRLGNSEKARELAARQLELSTDNPHACGQALRVLAFACDPAERGTRLRQAVQYFSDVGDEFELIKTRRLLGAEIALPAMTRTVSATVEETNTAAEQADPTVISSAELRVAQLAALGRTNRQIGKSLFITVSTVEQHLTRVYRKLGIRGRSALAAKLDDLAPNPDNKDERAAS